MTTTEVPLFNQEPVEYELLRQKGITPNAHYTLMDPLDRELERELHAEIYDDPDLRLDDLTDEELSRLRFVAVPTTHTARYAPHVAARLLDADYVLLESVGFREEERLGIDMASNLMLRGATLGVSEPNLVLIEMKQLERPELDWRPQIMRLIAEVRRDDMPIFRIIDIGSDDPDFAAHQMMPEALMLACNSRDLYGVPYDKLTKKVHDQLLQVGEGLRIRDLEQLTDISNIAAKAVRSHPEKPTVTIGISIGAAHSMAVRKLQLEGFPVDMHWVGPMADRPQDALCEGGSRFSFTLADSLLRKANLCPQDVDEADIHCLILFRHIVNALSAKLPFMMHGIYDENMLHVIDAIASAAVYEMRPDQHKELLEGIQDNRSWQGIPGWRNLRLGIAAERTQRHVINYLDTSLGSLRAFTTEVIRELNQR